MKYEVPGFLKHFSTPCWDRVRVIRTTKFTSDNDDRKVDHTRTKVRFSGSAKAFRIWIKSHVLDDQDDVQCKSAPFGPRGTSRRVLLPRADGSEPGNANGLKHSIFGCHSARRGEGY